MARMPAVSSASWHALFVDDKVKVYQDGNDDIFFKVQVKGTRTKYFYNETAWSDVSRYLVDTTGDLSYWSALS
jgi:hypothetical protein